MTDDIKKFVNSIDWPGAIAFTLACGLSLSMVLMIVAAMLRTNPMGEAGASVISTVFGAAIGAIATYIGQAKRFAAEKETSNE